jgi:hypothetical protein
MAQTVFDPGDPITSRLTLGVTPDGSTVASVVVTRPDGTVITGLTPSSWVGDVKTVQWYATDDGTSDSTTDAASGDWLAVWTVIGTGASVSPKIYAVQALPTAEPALLYQPFLHEVGDLVSWLTLSTVIPGGSTFLGTFTGETWPTDEVVARQIRLVTAPVAARWPDLSTSLRPVARNYIAVAVAAILARSYPRPGDDRSDATALERQAEAMWEQLVQLADDQTTSPAATAQVPVWSFPEPVAWGDSYL